MELWDLYDGVAAALYAAEAIVRAAPMTASSTTISLSSPNANCAVLILQPEYTLSLIHI